MGTLMMMLVTRKGEPDEVGAELAAAYNQLSESA